MRLVRPHAVDLNLRSGPQMREYDHIVDRIARDEPGRLLDWGCGLGQVSHLLQGRGVDVTAFDYRGHLTEPVVAPLDRFPGIDAHLSPEPVALPFEDASFDSVLSCGVLEHVHDPDASLEELKRVLVPGGTLYVYKLPNRFSYLEAIARRIGTIYYHGKLTNDRLYDARSARDIVQRHGYSVQHLRRANMLPLTLPGRVAATLTPPIWGLNRLLSAVPGLNVVATNVELVATAPDAG